MRTLALICVALIYALGAYGLPEATGKAPQGQAQPATPSPPAAPPPAGPWKCDANVRDHRARVCQVRYSPLCDPHLPASQVTTCALPSSNTNPPGCFCTCDVLCDSKGRRETKPGEIILGN